MKKILALILALSMILIMLASCSSENDPKGSESASNQQSKPGESQSASEAGSASESESATKQLSDAEITGLEDLNYGNNEVWIYHWQASYPEYDVDGSTTAGDAIPEAVYTKNMHTEELLGVDLQFHEEYDSTNASSPYITNLLNAFDDTSVPLDIASAYSRTIGNTAVKGIFLDLNLIDTLDLNKEWWPKYIRDEYNIADRMYFISGDISSNMLLMMYGVFYNKSLITTRGIDNPVDLVRSNEWTLDKYIEINTNVGEDIDSVSGKSPNDFFGTTLNYWDFDSFYTSCGFKLVEKSGDDDAPLKYSDDLFGGEVDTFVDKLAAFTKSSDVYNSDEYKGYPDAAFLEDRALFRITAANFGFTLRETDVQYGIVPCPKLNSDQQDLYTCLANPFSLYAIISRTKDADRAGAVLQALGYYGYKHTSPAVFDVTIKGKFSTDPDMFEMWNLIRENVSLDIGRIYHGQLNGLCDVTTMCIHDNLQLSTKLSGVNLKALTKKMNTLNTNLKNLNAR